MKYYFNKIIAIVLSFFILITSFLSCSICVYAITPEEFVGAKTWKDMSTSQKWETIFMVICGDMRALYNGDPSSFLESRTALNDFMNANDPDDFVTEEGLTIPEDFVALIKQALIEYADETNGFIIQQTHSYKEVPASTFTCKEDYEAFRSYASSHSLTYFYYYPSRYMYLGDLTENLKEGGGFVFQNGYYADYYMYNSDWKKFSLSCNYYTVEKGDSGIFYFNQPEERDLSSWLLIKYKAEVVSFQTPYSNFAGYLLTKDGGRIRIFKSLTEFMDYSAGQRKVYFGSGFYDYEPSEITATWDEINDTLDHMDDILQQLLDKINDSTDESAIEELLQEILDAIRNGGGGGTGSGGGIGGVVSQWYEDVLNYLDKILKQLKSIKRWTVIDTFIDGADAIADWLDLIHDVLSDVDDGAESAIATLSDALDDATGLLKSKFPFSVPWDIFFFVTLLAAEPETPYFEVPIDFDVSAINMHIHYDFVVDFSDYKYLSDICRVVLSMTYAVGLMKMTAGIVNTKKEE